MLPSLPPVPAHDDVRLSKALGHPLRAAILECLTEAESSPSEIAEKLGKTVGSVSYHTRVLRDAGCIELVRTAPRRGAVQHYYRATVLPMLSDELYARLPVKDRRRIARRLLRWALPEVVAAARSSGFDSPGCHVIRIPLELDDDGWFELGALAERLIEDVLSLQRQSAARADGAAARPSVLLLLHFERPLVDSEGKGSRSLGNGPASPSQDQRPGAGTPSAAGTGASARRARSSA
jgi:DNA-binding transcriptional ArsR family regulator